MPHYKTRQSWVVRLGPHRLTPEAPWVPGTPAMLTDTWAFTYAGLGECMYGELGLSADPGIPLDQWEVLIWETPDDDRAPDFRGVAGIVRGNDDLDRGAYSLAVVGWGDLDENELAIYSTYTRLGVGETLAPEGAETIGAFHARLLEPFGDGSWGVRGNGQRVVGIPSWLSAQPIRFLPTQIINYRPSGYQRRDYVTTTSASPGGRWKRLYARRPPPLPFSPRVYAEASSDNLLLLDQDRVPPNSAYLTRTLLPDTGTYASPVKEGAWDSQTLDGQGAGVLSEAATPFAQSEIPTVRLGFRYELPLSDLVRTSESSRFAEDATQSIKKLSFSLEPRGLSELAESSVTEMRSLETPVTLGEQRRSRGNLLYRMYLVASPGLTFESALHHLFTESANLDDLQQGEEARIPVEVPEDLVTEVNLGFNNGNYLLVFEGRYDLPAAYRWVKYQKPATDGQAAPPPTYQRTYAQARATLTIHQPSMLVDALVDEIPPENYPPGWDAPSISPPTAQGEVEGALIPLEGAMIGNQYVTHSRVVRTYTRYYSELQTGARQTQKLLRAEKKLKTAVDNERGKGGAW